MFCAFNCSSYSLLEKILAAEGVAAILPVHHLASLIRYLHPNIPRSSFNAVFSVSNNVLKIVRHLSPISGTTVNNLGSLNTSIAGFRQDLTAAGIFDICSRIIMKTLSISSSLLKKGIS